MTEQNIDQIIGKRIKSWRNFFGASQEDICRGMAARGFEFFQSTVHNIENGKRKVTVGEAVAFAEIFNIDLSKLTTFDRGEV